MSDRHYSRIRLADHRDIPILAHYTRRMVQEMETHGGYQTLPDHELYERFIEHYDARVGVERYLHLITENGDGKIGMLEASTIEIEQFFKSLLIVHIHAVFVLPEHRGQGIARRLIEQALSWGRERGAHIAELVVLANNPAKKLYDKLGFRVMEHQMIRKL